MEILVVSHKYPPSIGGMQKQCFELVKGLKQHHVIHELIYKGKGSNIAFLLTAAFRALQILRHNRKIEILYANDGLMAFFLTPVFWWSKVKKVVTIHGLDIVFPTSFYQSWTKKYLNKCHAVIAVSDATGKELLDRGIKKELVQVIKNGFDPKLEASDAVSIPPLANVLGKKPILVSVGRSVKRKGFSWFIKNIVPSLDQDVVYVIIGPTLGNHQKILRWKKWLPESLFNLIVLLNGVPLDEIEVHRLLKEMKLEDRVFHISGLTNKQVKEVLRIADIFVMPNLKIHGDYEGFGLVALEAVLAGTLCLAADTDGIPSAIQHEKNGYLLPSGGIKEWERTIEKFLINKSLLKNKSEEFRDYTLKHCLTWEKMAEQYIAVFERI